MSIFFLSSSAISFDDVDSGLQPKFLLRLVVAIKHVS
jgi:hypothetical protein